MKRITLLATSRCLLTRARLAVWVAMCCTALGCGESGSPSGGQGLEAGRKLFVTYCAACHHPEGKGLEGGPPPLTDSPWVSGPADRVVRIVLHGLRGPIEVGGRDYDLEMPAFGGILTDPQIADIVNFVRSRFADADPSVSPSKVSTIRSRWSERDSYWSAEELRSGS